MVGLMEGTEMATSTDSPAKGQDIYQIQGYEVLEKTAKATGTTARVLVPRSWAGKRVKIVRVEP